MSSLARDAAAFKSSLHRQDFTSWHSNPGPPVAADAPAPSASGSGSGELPKKKKPKTSSVCNRSHPLLCLPNCRSFGRCRVLAASRHWDGHKHQYAARVCCRPFKSEKEAGATGAALLMTLLMQQHGNPMRLQDLVIITNTPLDTNAVLLDRFRSHDRVVHDPKTDLYSYRVRLFNSSVA